MENTLEILKNRYNKAKTNLEEYDAKTKELEAEYFAGIGVPEPLKTPKDGEKDIKEIEAEFLESNGLSEDTQDVNLIEDNEVKEVSTFYMTRNSVKLLKVIESRYRKRSSEILREYNISRKLLSNYLIEHC